MNGAPKVWLSGVSIPNGGADDVGNQAPTTIHLSYTVDNSAGTDQLIVTDVTADNLVNVRDFTLLRPVPINVAAGDTGSIDISFDVDALGAFSLDVHIANNDLDENPYDIQITGSGAALPEMDVLGNGRSIPNGDNSPTAVDKTDFGNVTLDGGAVTYTYTIRNSGGVDLNLTGNPTVVIGGSHAAEFALITDATTPVAAGGGETTFAIRFDPRGEGLRQAIVSIANDDGDENPYQFVIQGTGVITATGGDGEEDGEEEPQELLAGVGSDGGAFHFKRIRVMVPSGSLASQSNCQLAISGKTGGNGFSLGDPAYDVTLTCEGQPPATFDAPLEVCLEPTHSQLQAAGGSFANLVIFHSHAGSDWSPLYDTYEKEGYLCVQMWGLSYFTISVPELPATGFAPGVVTTSKDQPAGKEFSALDGIWLEIPALGVELPIVGVPLTTEGWEVTWLGAAAGYLEGTAFPTWKGNTVITAHVWGANNQPGPFVDLHTLKYGDEIIIQAWSLRHIYQVRAVQWVEPDDLSVLPMKRTTG